MNVPLTVWLALCLIWGTTYLAIRVALDAFPVLLLAGIRWMSAGVLMCGALAALSLVISTV